MRLGGPLVTAVHSPVEWVAALKKEGYRAAYCPLSAEADDAEVRSYTSAASEADIVIAEVGAWSNPLSPDAEISLKAIEYCKIQLDLADRIGAKCCVNISGSCGDQWDGPHRNNLTAETFDRIVQNSREIIDAVNPKRTYFTLETMPWSYPDSAASYSKLIDAIDRPHFGVHLDPVNFINSLQNYYYNSTIIREAFQQLGPHIRSCHAKDILLAGKLTLHLDEVRPGLGELDYDVYLKELNRLDPNIPLMLEHLSAEEEYRLAASYIRVIAADNNIV